MHTCMQTGAQPVMMNWINLRKHKAITGRLSFILTQTILEGTEF